MAQLRIPLDEKRFNSGLTWKDYLAQMGDTKRRTEENYSKAGLTDDERKFFSGIGQVKYVLMLAENWSGDVHRNSPMIARIVESMPGAEMRVLLRDQHPDLTECFLNNGYRSIPVVVFFDKDWNEVGRWIERAGTATQKSFAIRAVTLDVATEDKKDAAMAEFRKQVQGTYDGPADKSMWRETAKEVRTVLEQRLGLVGKK